MKTILIIEDEEIMLDLLRYKINASGYRVLISRNGEEAMVVLKKERPDLIVMDLLMPKMDGFSTMKEIQKDESLKKIPLIIISNSGQPVELDEAKKLGAIDWLVKAEFDPQELIDKIDFQLNQR